MVASAGEGCPSVGVTAGIITQQGRWLLVDSPLGKDALILTSFAGDEAMSRPFSYRLTVLSKRADLTAKDVLGKPFTASIHRHDRQLRVFHGVARSLAAGPTAIRGYRAFEIELVPWLWLLTLRSDCRIFEHKSAVEVIRAVFQAAGFSDFDDAGIKGNHAKREYIVQYRESDFDFVSRLMEDEGIFYFFRHEKGRHVLVMGDHISAYATCAEKSVSYSDGQDTFNVVSEWRPEVEFRSGKFAQRDYDFRSASPVSASTTAILGVAEFQKYEIYDYPGGSEIKGTLDDLTRVRMEEEEAQHNEVFGQSTCTSFVPGAKFKFGKHPFKDEIGKGYLVTSLRHWAVDESHIMNGRTADYGNSFHCIPEGVLYRPLCTTPKAQVRGPQTALVIGPEGEEIHTDEHGRIRVRFHWDRKGAQSCWARVAQAWAGKGWGTIFIPRIGMEVVVDFLEGDPDRPLVVGCVYNGKNTVPYGLPANASQSGIKTRSTKGGGEGNFNELRFEDKKGKEEVYLHAERNCTRSVEANDSVSVGHNQSVSIGHDRTETVKNNDTVTVTNNRAVTVKSGNESLTVATGTRTVTVKGDDTHKVQSGNRSVKVESGNDSLEITAGNQSTKASAGKISLEAAQSIELKVGGSIIKIDPSGISINGLNVKVEGGVMVETKGAKVKIGASGDIAINGKLITLN